MPHPPEVVERIKRLYAFHQRTKEAPPAEQVNQSSNAPTFFRVYPSHQRVPLPTILLDAATPTLRLLESGIAAMPESLIAPPQDLKTLATWLHLAAGITGKTQLLNHTHYLRAYPSAGALYPCEIYVLALGIDGLDPGFYHFCAKDFSLCKLREGWEALWQLKRGRPDLEMLKTMPAALLISSIPWRSAWKYGRRGLRYANLEAGHLIENFVQSAAGLGIQTVTRLHLNGRNTRDLIGLEKDCSFDQFEIVQGMVAWGDRALHPIKPINRTQLEGLPPIPRGSVSSNSIEYPDVRSTHEDCVAPGVGVHEVRPPFTDRCPLAVGCEHAAMASEEVFSDFSLLHTLAKRRSVHAFDSNGLSRDYFGKINRLAFASGTYHPILPSGTHLGLIRPFWFLHNITGVEPGLYYYHANYDEFTPLRYGDFRFDAKYLFNDQEFCGQASAVCMMVCELHDAMHNAGPDCYRLAHLEAGIAAQRIYLACTALAVECCSAGSFLDEEVHHALDLESTEWQCIYGMALGGVRRPKTVEPVAPTASEDDPPVHLR